ncbi:MAG: hypothetical protein AUH13_26050 [Acidobacteria bacterium 13_2_20CM_58_27]|nr:MAG: hypothetical protein AUH13_26050 [Acidobacteria bacterium 13_2_20CM_58_27]
MTEHVVDGMTSSAAAREQEVVRLRQPGSWRKSAQLHNTRQDVLRFLIDGYPAFGMELAQWHM